MAEGGGSRLTVLGVVVSVLLIGCLGVVGIGVVATGMLTSDRPDEPSADPVPPSAAPDLELVAAESEVPRLEPAAPFVLGADRIVRIELSEYAGYAGLIVANGGLAPNPESWFAKNGGFQVQLTVSEADAWSPLNTGKIAGSATTVDVLPLYGRQFDVVVPAQIGFSRGADGIVVDKDIKRLNDLRGKVVVTSQFGEADFFLRYLAQEAGIPVLTADSPTVVDPAAIHVVYAEDAFAAADVYLADLDGGDQLAGCVTWEPKTSEVVAGSGGRARTLTTNRNLLVVADVLVLNRGFAEANPEVVGALVEGLLVGNDQVRTEPAKHVAVVGKAFGWTEAQTIAELQKVHLSNLPENLAFFGGQIDMAGSFGGIFQSAVLAYGRALVRDAVSPDRFVSVVALEALKKEGKFAAQQVSIAPIKAATAGSIEDDPLLSKDIRFLFEPNSSRLDQKDPQNLENLKALHQLLQVSPGSTLLMRGHVDGGRKEDFLKQGGEAFVREMSLKAVALSMERAKEVEAQLVSIEKVDDKRVESVGLGWDEPASTTDVDANRRVEAQWFTLE